MGQKHSKSSSPPSTRTSQPIKPLPLPEKSSLMQKIKLIMSKNREKSTSLSFSPSFFSKKREHNRFAIERKKNLESETMHVSFSVKEDEKEALAKMKKRLSRRMETKDLTLGGGSAGRDTRRLSLFESMGISPTLSPTAPLKRGKEIQRFSINNSEGLSLKSPKINGTPKTDSGGRHGAGVVSFTEGPLDSLGRAPSQGYQQTPENAEKKGSLFQSPLIKRTSPQGDSSLDLASLLVSSFSDYLQTKRLKNLANMQKDSRKAFLKNKAMKEMLNSNSQRNELVMKELEQFDPKSCYKDGDYKETMEYYRREKFRKDLFENKLRDDDPNVRPLLDSISQSMGIKTRGPKGRESSLAAKLLGARLKHREGSAEIVGSHSLLAGKGSLISDNRIKTDRFNEGNEDFVEEREKPIEKKEKSIKRRENSTENFAKSLERIDKSSFRLDSFQESPQNLEKAPKIVFPSSLKLIERVNTRMKGSQSQFSPQSMTLPSPEKPVKVFKKHRRLVFLKNRILEIQDGYTNSNTLTSERDESSKLEDPLFLKIVRNGVSPTKFFLQHTKN